MNNISLAVYRGGPETAVPQGKNALDVVRYEREELGNAITTLVPESELSGIDGQRIAWVGPTPESVAEFGDVSKINQPYRVLATDPDGNMLVELKRPATPREVITI